MSSAVYTTTVETDYQTHSVIADTLTGSAALMWSLIDDGAVQPYTSPIVSQMGYSSTTYGADYATTSIQPNVLVYNPTYLTQHDIPIPTSWQNLTNPVYKGLITFQNPATLSSTGGIFYYLAQQMTNSSWNTLMKGIAANNPIVTTSPVTSVDDVYEGTAAIGITIFNDYSSLLSAGTTTNSSLAIDEQGQFSTSIYTPGYVSIANGAPDPYMGELMESWLLSPPGQTAFAFIATVPLFTPIAQELNEVPSSLTLVNGFGNPALFNDTGSWSDLFNNIFSGT